MPKDKRESQQWPRRPERTDTPMRYPLLRTPPKGAITGQILSHDIIGRYTHYWRGRTAPCLTIDCEACDKGENARWHGWLMLACISTGAKSIFEITSAAADPFDEYFKQHRTLRGAIIEAKRIPQRPNGRVVIRIKKGAKDTSELPKAPDLKPILLRMWDMREDLDQHLVTRGEGDLAGQEHMKFTQRSKASSNGNGD